MTRHTHPTWRKSSYSGDTGECVELADLGGKLLGVRDSKHPEGPVLAVESAALRSLFTQIRTGFLDR